MLPLLAGAANHAAAFHGQSAHKSALMCFPSIPLQGRQPDSN
jgi:hypothetical protein